MEIAGKRENRLDKDVRETIDILKTRINIRRNCDLNTALHLSIINDNIKLINLLLKAGARIDIPNSNGKTALLLGVKHRFPVIKNIFNREKEKLKLKQIALAALGKISGDNKEIKEKNEVKPVKDQKKNGDCKDTKEVVSVTREVVQYIDTKLGSTTASFSPQFTPMMQARSGSNLSSLGLETVSGTKTSLKPICVESSNASNVPTVFLGSPKHFAG